MKSGKKQEIISPEDVFELIEESDEDSNYMLIDVRPSWGFSEKHIAGALNLDCSDPEFKEQLQELDQGKKYIIYCKSGFRGGKTRDFMEKNGFSEVYNMKGGLDAWKEANLPTKSGPQLINE
ncbi:MAG: rhodanese-like domain-containing protein [Methanobacteriaceae archaeon]